jgi:hypothetical protein
MDLLLVIFDRIASLGAEGLGGDDSEQLLATLVLLEDCRLSLVYAVRRFLPDCQIIFREAMHHQ